MPAPKNQLESPKTFLVISNFHGQRQVAFYYDWVPDDVRNRRRIGLATVQRIIELTPEQKALGEESLRRLFANDDEPEVRSKEQIDGAEKLRRIPTLIGIIKTSNQDGEVAAARAKYREYTGQEYAD